MQKIKSFQVDHTKIEKGMYISRIDDDIVTYDIRMVKPNTPPFLPNGALHTIEHLMATFVRNSNIGNKVIYCGPMGCRTGFYLLLRNVPYADAINLVQKSFDFIANYTGKIPGVSKEECGNYLDHDLPTAKKYALDMAKTLSAWSVNDLNY